MCGPAGVHRRRGWRPGPTGRGLRPATEIAELFCATERISSLDAPRSDSDDRALIEQLVVENEAGTGAAHGDESPSPIEILFAQLPERQRHVLERRYGLNDHGVQTLAEIAAELGLTRERVRQIQSEGLARLRRLAEQTHAGSG